MSPAARALAEGLSRGEGVAAWRQIADALAAEIAAGRLAPGDRLPAEARLAERWGVNRHTVRRALAALAERGLVRAKQGSGTHVEARPIPYPIGPRTRFGEIVSRAGRKAGGTLLASGEAPADAWAADRLGLAQGAPVLELVTLRSADSVPIALATDVFPLPRFAGLDARWRETGSITRALAAAGVGDYRRRTSAIGARPATREEAVHLHLAPGRILLVLDNVNVDEAGDRIQATRALFPADRVELNVVG